MNARLLDFMNFKGFSPSKFADELGVQRSSISHIISGRNKPGYDFIYKILNHFKELNAEWLILGIGEMIKDSNSSPKTQTQYDLFSSLKDMGVDKKKDMAIDQTLAKNESAIDRILLIYDDKTFVEIKPKIS